MNLIISENKMLNDSIFNDLKENKNLITLLGRGLNNYEVYSLYELLENLFKIQTETDILLFNFNYEDICIINPFYAEDGRDLVKPISYYGDYLLKSNFIELIKEVMLLDINEETYKEEIQKLTNKFEDIIIKKLGGI